MEKDYTNCDQCYWFMAESFEQVSKFIIGMADQYKDFEIIRDTLVIQINEGVFLRTKNPSWCELLDIQCNHFGNEGLMKEISVKEWNDLTIQYDQAIESLGDGMLADWGFDF